jgi:uncharacterized protein (TIGR02588 family)
MKRNALEWSVFALGLFATLSILGYLGYEIATHRTGVPRVEVTMGQVEKRGDVFLVPVTAKNGSDETLEGVILEASLRVGKDEQKAQFELAFLPRRSQREGWFTFTQNPERGKLEARAIGYERP